ncbi:MAG: integrase [Hydrogenophilaceae bacterium CG1_02_62_390]|nr:tyrosine-type recombinase/integrase [Betaproteobacteria bacterium]OIO77930.1 MAG: integrase [Hydrogenophilaceae bacterium CG1_02_62_390]PIW38278.1 MAG: integrase [Hydrogenophilales bacterium CG15_BIG_FIL_POST_REV_8_21_14_020_62_31]PIW72444.1 MAG: integrase [Hydrogenophilales bacterium CG12_big_fil_rev_8_21_14_0_65_61_21]
MALSDTKLRNLKPSEKTYREADQGGLFVDVSPKGKKAWGLRYWRNGKQERIGLGDYPTYSLAEARTWRDDCKALAGRGLSPMALKRGDPIPGDAAPAVKELAQAFIRNWCMKAVEMVKAKEGETKAANTVEAFARRWYAEIVEPANSSPRNIKRVLDKDVIPAIGAKQVADVTVADILAITDKIKNRGADQMALQTRNVLKRLFAYAIAREKTQFNPAAAIEAKFIASARSRDVALSSEEVGKLLRAIYQSSMKRAHKLALHLLILCMVRKSELIEAKWEELDLEKAEWAIPGERMKKDKPHLVSLSRQAVAMFEELKGLASGSEWVFPSRGDLKQPIAKSTLNVAVRALAIDVRDFVIHDFRRTSSTHLHEAGFNSDWIEKCLAHETKGIRGVYNRAQYADQRREMLQWWADFVDSQIDEGRKVIIGRFGKAYQAERLDE